MLEINYTPKFIKNYKKIKNEDLKKEIKEKIELLKKEKNHEFLKIHKLKGPLKGSYSFSVNYKYRIVFEYLDKQNKKIILLSVGDHEIYKI